jgi:hypothetical protein
MLAALRRQMPQRRAGRHRAGRRAQPGKCAISGRTGLRCAANLAWTKRRSCLPNSAMAFLPDAVIADCYRLADALFLPSLRGGLRHSRCSKLPSAGCLVFCSAIEPLTELGGADVAYFDPTGDPATVAAQRGRCVGTVAPSINSRRGRAPLTPGNRSTRSTLRPLLAALPLRKDDALMPGKQPTIFAPFRTALVPVLAGCDVAAAVAVACAVAERSRPGGAGCGADGTRVERQYTGGASGCVARCGRWRPNARLPQPKISSPG